MKFSVSKQDISLRPIYRNSMNRQIEVACKKNVMIFCRNGIIDLYL